MLFIDLTNTHHTLVFQDQEDISVNFMDTLWSHHWTVDHLTSLPNWRIPTNCKVTSSYPVVHTRETNIMSSGPSAVTTIQQEWSPSSFIFCLNSNGSFALVAQLLQTWRTASHHRPKLRPVNIHSNRSNGTSKVWENIWKGMRSDSPCPASRFDHNHTPESSSLVFNFLSR